MFCDTDIVSNYMMGCYNSGILLLLQIAVNAYTLHGLNCSVIPWWMNACRAISGVHECSVIPWWVNACRAISGVHECSVIPWWMNACRAISGVHECRFKISRQSRLLHRLKAYLEQIIFDCRLRWVFLQSVPKKMITRINFAITSVNIHRFYFFTVTTRNVWHINVQEIL